MNEQAVVDNSSAPVDGSSLAAEAVLEPAHSDSILDDSQFQDEPAQAPIVETVDEPAIEQPAEAPEEEAAAEPAEAVAEEVWYSHIDGLASAAGATAAPTPPPAPVEAAVPAALQEWVTPENFEQLLTDPAALNTVLQNVHNAAFQRAREDALLQVTIPQVENHVKEFFGARPQLDTPVIKEQLAKAVTEISRAYPDADIATVFAHAERYVETYAKRNPHKLVKFDAGLPPLPGAPKAASAAGPLRPPTNVVRPTFPGGGGAARRIVPTPKTLDPLQSELDSLSPDDIY
jgi:hypothetical protein